MGRVQQLGHSAADDGVVRSTVPVPSLLPSASNPPRSFLLRFSQLPLLPLLSLSLSLSLAFNPPPNPDKLVFLVQK